MTDPRHTVWTLGLWNPSVSTLLSNSGHQVRDGLVVSLWGKRCFSFFFFNLNVIVKTTIENVSILY